jgi:hypothetical protein|eukprot:COSAG06_NODE_1490_length_9281_cov_6.074820_6_plen_82_part_00
MAVNAEKEALSAGVLMYGHGPRAGFPNATNTSTAASDKATIEIIQAANAIMLELYPVRKMISFAPFYAKYDHFTETGSGQT